MRVLAVETSCDETAAAVLDSERGLLAHELWSQVELHRAYGGVVPELASRDHLRRLLPLVRQALASADTAPKAIDGVAFTAGPGLVGALLTGAALARALAYAWERPAIGVHHLEGHLLAPMLETPAPPLPHTALLVSGGHTLLAEVHAVGEYRVLGQTRDDAAGEAFDKSAKLLGLPDPGGPELAALAEQGRPGCYELPRPMLDRPGFEFSFSGLKTAVSQAVSRASYASSHAATPVAPMAPMAHDLEGTAAHCAQWRADLARAVQEAIVATLCTKAMRALQFTGHRSLVVAGGVGANRALRDELAREAKRIGAQVYFPRPAFCTDNAAMIAVAGLYRLQAGERTGLEVEVRARWPLEELTPPGAGAGREGSMR
jgi:N6-L-threonylcarbamoyladenine synthase